MFYVLLVLCMTAALASDICHWGTYALIMAYICLGAVCEWRQWKKPLLFKILGVVLFFALFVIDMARGGGLQEMVLSACLNIVWTLVGYRALKHEKTSERVQIGVIAVLPLACVAFAMSATALIIFLIAYFSVLFVYLGHLALAVPTTGSVAYSENMAKVRYLRMPGRRFWVKTSLLGLLAFAVGSLLFLVVPRWGNDAVSAMPTVQPSRSGFPDVALDKTGTIQLDPSLMFRVALPKTAEPRYWRIEAQNIFDGKKWRAIGGQREIKVKPDAEDTAYRLEFVHEWRDHRIPTLYGTTIVSRLPEEENFRVKFYSDAADVWHRWGWRRGNPMMGFVFQMKQQENVSENEFKTMTENMRAFFENVSHFQEAAKSGTETLREKSNIAYVDRDNGRRRIYYQTKSTAGGPRFSIAVRAEDNRPMHFIAWHLVNRLKRDLKPLPQRHQWTEKPRFHQDTSLFLPHRIWPGRKKGSESVHRIQTLAKTIVGDASTNAEKAERVQDYLRSNFQYSLERPERKAPVVEDFLFVQKFGHCEMFSTTMAVLLSSIDVPVRNVSGFVSDEYRDGMHHVRAAHAHSWVEVFVDDVKGWTVYDPTPPGSTDVEVSWLIRIDDWFTSYQTRDLYEWLKQHGWMALAVILGGLCFVVFVRMPVVYVRRRLKPVSEVWQMAWDDVMAQCRKNTNTETLVQRSLESWWESKTQDDLTVFAHDYIGARYDRQHENSQPADIRRRFAINRQILCRKNKIMRALKSQKRAHDEKS